MVGEKMVGEEMVGEVWQRESLVECQESYPESNQMRNVPHRSSKCGIQL